MFYVRFSALDMYLNLNSLVFTGKIFARKSSYDSDSSSLTVASSDKVLVPESQSDASSASTDQLEVPGTVSEEPQVLILLIHTHITVVFRLDRWLLINRKFLIGVWF